MKRKAWSFVLLVAMAFGGGGTFAGNADVKMVPLRDTAEALGYTVTWNDEAKRVELVKGPHYTYLVAGENAYVFARMAPFELSAAPIIDEGRLHVPVEFFPAVLKVDQAGQEVGTFEGVITEMTAERIVLGEDPLEQIVLHRSENSILQGDFQVGDHVTAITQPMMTMSIPAQTGLLILY